MKFLNFDAWTTVVHFIPSQLWKHVLSSMSLFIETSW